MRQYLIEQKGIKPEDLEDVEFEDEEQKQSLIADVHERIQKGELTEDESKILEAFHEKFPESRPQPPIC